MNTRTDPMYVVEVQTQTPETITLTAYNTGVDQTDGAFSGEHKLYGSWVTRYGQPVAITLTASAMGGATEADFDRWAAWVAAHVDEACGVDATVHQHRFGGGPDEDTVRGADEDTVAAVRQWLSVEGWGQWCAKGAPDGEGA
jgi:hypothetical protein